MSVEIGAFGITLDRWEIRIYSLRGPFMRAFGFDGIRPYYFNPQSRRGW